VTLRARWATLRARWVTLRARWVTLRARWVDAESSLGDVQVAVHTGALEEQVASAGALGAYAGATGAAFLPYLCGSLEALDGAVRHPSPALRLAAVGPRLGILTTPLKPLLKFKALLKTFETLFN
jgi:hypothetical protein